MRAILPNPDQVLVPGNFVRVRVGAPDEQESLLVPDAALGSDQGGRYLLVLDQNNTVRTQGYMIAIVQLPDGASLERTQKTLDKVFEITRKTPGVARVVTIAGVSPLDNSATLSSAGVAYVILEDWSASGAGASARTSIGIRVFTGMIASTCLAVLFVPPFFVVAQHFEEWRRAQEPLAGAHAGRVVTSHTGVHASCLASCHGPNCGVQTMNSRWRATPCRSFETYTQRRFVGAFWLHCSRRFSVLLCLIPARPLPKT